MGDDEAIRTRKRFVPSQVCVRWWGQGRGASVRQVGDPGPCGKLSGFDDLSRSARTPRQKDRIWACPQRRGACSARGIHWDGRLPWAVGRQDGRFHVERANW